MECAPESLKQAKSAAPGASHIEPSFRTFVHIHPYRRSIVRVVARSKNVLRVLNTHAESAGGQADAYRKIFPIDCPLVVNQNF